VFLRLSVLELWTDTRQTGVSVTCVLGYLPTNFGLPSTFVSRVIHYVRDRQTDGQMDGQKQRLMPPTLRAGA